MAEGNSVIAECGPCGGTGLYCGFAEPKRTAVICHGCNGTGAVTLTWKPYTGRKRRKNVSTIRLSRGTFLPTGVGPYGPTMTYDEFEKQYPAKI